MAALTPYRGPWDRKTAKHLIYRAGFGANAATITEMVKVGMGACVEGLVNFEGLADPYPKPEWAKPAPDIRAKFRDASAEEKKMYQRERHKEAEDARGWWLKRMVTTPRPLQEKLTLFWHGHFATSIQKVKLPYFMWLQNETFRRNAIGNWRTMLDEVSKDPAMVIWLDNISNRASGPNENFARELMELFTLGEGNYSEADIKESARAFTGYSIDRTSQEFVFRKMLHDNKSKKFFGRSGNFEGDDIIELILAQPQAAKFISKKIWEFFVYQDPSDELVAQLASILTASKFEFRPLLRTIFSSEEFFSAKAVKKQIKSPVQLMVGALIALQAAEPPARLMIGALRMLGQDLFAPPNVKGWDGGAAWITTSSLLIRYNLSNFLVTGTLPEDMFRQPGGGAKGKKAQSKGKDAAPAEAEAEGKGEGMEEQAMEEQRARFRERAGRRAMKLIDVSKLVDLNTTSDAAGVVGQLSDILYLDGMSPKDRGSIEEYLGSAPDDAKIRGALHLMMSTPHYQLC